MWEQRIVAPYRLEKAHALGKAAHHLRLHPEISRSYVTDVFPDDDVNRALRAAMTPAAGQLKILLSAGLG